MSNSNLVSPRKNKSFTNPWLTLKSFIGVNVKDWPYNVNKTFFKKTVDDKSEIVNLTSFCYLNDVPIEMVYNALQFCEGSKAYFDALGVITLLYKSWDDSRDLRQAFVSLHAKSGVYMNLDNERTPATVLLDAKVSENISAQPQKRQNSSLDNYSSITKIAKTTEDTSPLTIASSQECSIEMDFSIDDFDDNDFAFLNAVETLDPISKKNQPLNPDSEKSQPLDSISEKTQPMEPINEKSQLLEPINERSLKNKIQQLD